MKKALKEKQKINGTMLNDLSLSGIIWRQNIIFPPSAKV